MLYKFIILYCIFKNFATLCAKTQRLTWQANGLSINTASSRHVTPSRWPNDLSLTAFLSLMLTRSKFTPINSPLARNSFRSINLRFNEDSKTSPLQKFLFLWKGTFYRFSIFIWIFYGINNFSSLEKINEINIIFIRKKII